MVQIMTVKVTKHMHATDETSQVSKYYFLEKQAWLFGSFYQCRKAVFFLLESINITQICFLFFLF